MATAQGVRFAVAGLPTPGSGLDDQDRYAVGSVVLPANSITPPTIGADFESKQRGAVGGVILPDSVLDDQQDRYHIAGVIQPTLENVNISAQQRAYVAGVGMYPGGTGFTTNDRAHIAGIYPYNEASVFAETFDLDVYSIANLDEVSTSVTGALNFVVSGFNTGFTIDGRINKGGSASKGHRYFVQLGDLRVEAQSLDHAQQLLDEYDRQAGQQKRIRKVITDSVKLELNPVPFNVRQRFVQRAIEVEKAAPERKRFIAKKVTEKPATIPERKKFVAQEAKKADIAIPERRRLIQRDKPAEEDPLLKILRKREK